MRRTALAAVLAIAAGAAAALAVGERWATGAVAPLPAWTRLPNGLQFRAQRLPHAKDVAIVTVFGVGSAHDPDGQSGLAHLAEHLYVTSAAGEEPARTAEEWAARYSGACAAQTHPEHTLVAVLVPPDRLELELRGVAARMTGLCVEASDLERERASVLQQIAERQPREGGPGWGAALRIARLRVDPTPNAAHRGGTPEDVARLSRDDVRRFMQRFYVPANARIAIAGNVDPAAAGALVARVFSGLPAGARASAPEPVEAQSGLFRIDGGERPGPEYEPVRTVCIAYPFRAACDEDWAVLLALGLRQAPGREFPRVQVLPQDDCVAVLGMRDGLPAEEAAQELDALVGDFVRNGTGAAAAERCRALWREMRERQDRGDSRWLAPRLEDGPRSMDVALELAFPGAQPRDWQRLLATLERLTNDDIRRSVAKWHVPERRIVVDYSGWRKPDPPPVAAPAETASRAGSTLGRIAEVHIRLTWDEERQTARRRMGDREFPDDDSLREAIAAAHAAWAKRGKPDAPVTIDADSDVPWDAVIGVVNLIKRCGIEKIEFAMRAPPQKAK